MPAQEYTTAGFRELPTIQLLDKLHRFKVGHVIEADRLVSHYATSLFYSYIVK